MPESTGQLPIIIRRSVKYKSGSGKIKTLTGLPKPFPLGEGGEADRKQKHRDAMRLFKRHRITVLHSRPLLTLPSQPRVRSPRVEAEGFAVTPPGSSSLQDRQNQILPRRLCTSGTSRCRRGDSSRASGRFRPAGRCWRRALPRARYGRGGGKAGLHPVRSRRSDARPGEAPRRSRLRCAGGAASSVRAGRPAGRRRSGYRPGRPSAPRPEAAGLPPVRRQGRRGNRRPAGGSRSHPAARPS